MRSQHASAHQRLAATMGSDVFGNPFRTPAALETGRTVRTNAIRRSARGARLLGVDLKVQADLVK